VRVGYDSADDNNMSEATQSPKSLPAWAIDLITDGVPSKDLATSGHKAVWTALVRTAASAQHNHWSVIDWEYLVLDERRHLGAQVATQGGRQRSQVSVLKQLHKAWDTAWSWRTQQPPWDGVQAQEQIHERAAALIALSANPDAPLTTVERDILTFAAELAIQRRNTKVAMPWRATKEKHHHGQTAIRNAHARLAARGLLPLHERGAPSGSRATKRRANLYRLPEANDPAIAHYLSRGARPVVPSTTSVVPHPGNPFGAFAISVVPPQLHATKSLTADGGPGPAGSLRVIKHADGRVEVEADMSHEHVLALLRSLGVQADK
jgi:hypothetical protein